MAFNSSLEAVCPRSGNYSSISICPGTPPTCLPAPEQRTLPVRQARLIPENDRCGKLNPPSAPGWSANRIRALDGRLLRDAGLIGIGAAVTCRPLPHHRAYGSVHGGSRSWASNSRTVKEGRVSGSMHSKLPRRELWSGPGTRGRNHYRPYWRPVAEYPQLQQRSSTTTWSFPLSPECASQSQPHPTNKADQHLGGFAKAEVAAPSHHIGGQSLHCRLDADPLGLSRDLTDFVFETPQSFRSNRSSDFWSVCKTKPEELRPCGRATALLVSFTLSLSR